MNEMCVAMPSRSSRSCQIPLMLDFVEKTITPRSTSRKKGKIKLTSQLQLHKIRHQFRAQVEYNLQLQAPLSDLPQALPVCKDFLKKVRQTFHNLHGEKFQNFYLIFKPLLSNFFFLLYQICQIFRIMPIPQMPLIQILFNKPIFANFTSYHLCTNSFPNLQRKNQE